MRGVRCAGLCRSLPFVPQLVLTDDELVLAVHDPLGQRREERWRGRLTHPPPERMEAVPVAINPCATQPMSHKRK